MNTDYQSFQITGDFSDIGGLEVKRCQGFEPPKAGASQA